MPREKPTAYRATWEFMLRYPADYEKVRAALDRVTKELADTTALQSSFLAIEKMADG